MMIMMNIIDTGEIILDDDESKECCSAFGKTLTQFRFATASYQISPHTVSQYKLQLLF